ncbi:VOC family protein [Altererythrobacter xixiisoli]|uniref:VOC family protein n=1 Tax=Croceibacterium xixiisoli TaxID=1476466 RepID=A0A6I4TRK5_9SPHN|nr:VOC family protein [Croceibacterium xixiisoli]MXO97771.1 VOC family protein [Croceibacterium xixiisoli]
MKPKISLVTLGVADLERSLAFYREGLGLQPHEYDPDAGVVFFPMEGSWLALFPREELAKDAGIGAAGSGFSGITLAHNEPDKAGVDAVFAQAVAAGATVIKPAQDVFWGGYSGYFADPDGHVWEVAWNPLTDLT